MLRFHITDQGTRESSALPRTTYPPQGLHVPCSVERQQPSIKPYSGPGSHMAQDRACLHPLQNLSPSPNHPTGAQWGKPSKIQQAGTSRCHSGEISTAATPQKRHRQRLSMYMACSFGKYQATTIRKQNRWVPAVHIAAADLRELWRHKVCAALPADELVEEACRDIILVDFL